MGEGAFITCLLVGAAAIALWTDVRLPRLAPKGLAGVTRHFLGALVALVVLTPLGAEAVAGETTSAVRNLLSLFAVALPALVYSMLVTLWLLRVAQQALRGGLR